MAPLLTALFDGAEPLLDRSALGDGGSLEPSFWSAIRLAAELERAASDSPLLVCIDDFDVADEETVAALGILTRRLLGLPVQWILSLRPSTASRAVSDLVGMLDGHAAERLVLEPLGTSAARLLTADLAGAEPSAELLEVATLAAGVPATLVELVRGLVEERQVRIEHDCAELVDWQIPRRIAKRISAAVDRTSQQARDVATVAAVLGNPVTLGHVASMLNVAPASLLAPIEELVQADLLVDDRVSLGFRGELVRRALIDQTAPSIAHALRLQAIDLLLEAGQSPLRPAQELVATAVPGDRAVIGTLTAASNVLGGTDPELAAQLCRYAFDVTAVGDERRPVLAATLATLLHDCGRGEDGRDVIVTMSREPIAPDDQAMIQLAAARMMDLAPEHRVEISEAAMATPGVSAQWQAAHAAELVMNRVDSGRLDLAAKELDWAGAIESGREHVATELLGLARARLTAAGGELEKARADVEAALPVLGQEPASVARRTELFHAEVLLALDDNRVLEQLVWAALKVAGSTGQVTMARSWRCINGRLLLRRGQLSEASTLLETELSRGTAVVTPDDARLLLTLGELAIHSGDARANEGARCGRRADRGDRGAGGPTSGHLALGLPGRCLE